MANSNCDKLSDALSAYADGELSPQETTLIEAHLESCAVCRGALAALKTTDRRLKALRQEERAPEDLWGKVMTSVATMDRDASEQDDEAAADSVWGASRFGRRQSLGIAAGVLLTLGVGLSSPYWSRLGGKNPLIVEPVNDFITFKVSERPLDMAASDPVALKEWFQGKVDFRLPLKGAEIDGYRLVGSRLCYFLKRRLSALMYERSGARISLYVMTGENLEVPEGTWEPAASREIASFAVEDYRNLIWQDGGLVYALVSDQPKDDMLRFVAGLHLDSA
ncbi:anti-sigma factor family protein [Denitrobaculum tricleocarpae]|uniref:Putative zinc-finger domain-containing protein n=1 Tax=Denitrobaculum tricleocarpae TaxID=2591009 RepID=A0A545SZC2_9PROT|nr:zf-HC2 domain-containing protein [Denitrobaculum tricleocarpae]TQV70322.1 hypothetical protein FKG95_28025 [Denitrobaculum tricleocarpae]